MIEKDKIYHCSESLASIGGGIKTYVDALFHALPSEFSTDFIASLKDIDQSQYKLLHIHEGKLLADLRGECPTIFTAHNHDAYCPSGTKYLSTSQSCCDRHISYLGCTWGHVVDGCGSRRPQRITANLRSAHSQLESLKRLQIPIIANSDYVRNQFIANGLPSKQVITLRYGIVTPNITVAPLTTEIHQNQRILFVGRIVPDKGLGWLFKALKATDSRIQLDIAGDGWDRLHIENLAKKLGLSDRITWHGWCSSDKLNSLYQQCFALVFPSVWPEPAGIVTLEAYARYRPVIAANAGGIPEHLQDGKTGLLVPANHVQALADAITEMSKNYQRCKLLGEQGYAWLNEEFTIDLHVRRLQQIYGKVIDAFSAKASLIF